MKNAVFFFAPDFMTNNVICIENFADMLYNFYVNNFLGVII